MISNRDRLRRTRDGRYEVGVYIERDKYARFVAKVLVAYDREGVSQVACRWRRTSTRLRRLVTHGPWSTSQRSTNLARRNL